MRNFLNNQMQSTAMTPNHEVAVDNFNPEDTIHYRIIIIKGHIKNKPNCICQAEQIYIHSGSSVYAFKIIDSKFKALTELQQGQNCIVLSYCCIKTTIRLNYDPRQTKYSVLPLYIICEGHDGKFQAPENQANDIESACKRITLGSKLLQSIFAEKLHEEKQARKTFRLESECQVFHSKLNYLEARQLSQEELWAKLGREIVNSNVGREEIKYLAFLSCTKYCGERYQDSFLHEDIVKSTQAYVALGGGGLALFGTACLFTWPEVLSQVVESFENDSPIDRRRFMDDSNYRGTFGGCFSTTLGSVLHELCHAFDLGHTEKGIMGRGFDDIYKVLVSQKIEKKIDIQKNFQTSIEFEEKFDSGLLSERLEEKKKTASLKTYRWSKDEDNTFWTKSCTVFLAYHKWFNNFEDSKNKVIKYDAITGLVSSVSGLRVIEARDEDDGMVLKFWIFDGKILKYSFQIPKDELQKLNRSSVMLVVEDNIGNILRFAVNLVVNN